MNRLRQILESRLQPSYLAALSGAIIVVSLALAASLFFTADRGRTAFGIPLGADFAGFYVAAQILNQGQTSQLYDRVLHHRMYHELLPGEDQRESIPYVHPPFVAGLLRPLAMLSYPTAVAVWLVISASLYVVSLALLLNAVAWQPVEQRWLVILLAVSFEPFLYECWMGGQLSAIAFSSFALCFAATQRGKSLSAGMALGICLYKPTLLLLIVPMLIIGGRWRILLGMTITGVALVILSLALVGWDVNVGYLNVLLSFQKSTSGGDLVIRTWKYVDINNCLRLLLGDGSSLRSPLLVLFGMIPIVFLVRTWWNYERLDQDYRRLVWATTITWVPVLNLYFGIYDSILIVQGVLITASSLRRDSRTVTPLTDSGFAYFMLAIYLTPWFSQKLAISTGIPAYTLLLMGMGTWQLVHFSRRRPSLSSAVLSG